MNASTTTIAATEKGSVPDLRSDHVHNDLEEQDQHLAEEYESNEESHHGSGRFPADQEAVEKQVEEHPPMQRASTRVSINNVSAIPNGGLAAWMQVLGAW